MLSGAAARPDCDVHTQLLGNIYWQAIANSQLMCLVWHLSKNLDESENPYVRQKLNMNVKKALKAPATLGIIVILGKQTGEGKVLTHCSYYSKHMKKKRLV